MNMEQLTMRIDIGFDFSKIPFGRYVTDGPNSGEKFRESKLKPAFQAIANKKDEKLEISFEHIDWAIGSSFLVEAFQEFVRRERIDPDYFLSKVVIIESEKDAGFYSNAIQSYVKELKD